MNPSRAIIRRLKASLNGLFEAEPIKTTTQPNRENSIHHGS